MSALVTTRLPQLVGRQQEKTKLKTIIRTAGSEAQLVLIIGPAGIGKTCLLDEIASIVSEGEKASTSILCPPVIDFYNTAMHSESAIEEAIATNLAQRVEDGAFEGFIGRLVAWREGRISEEQLWGVFKEGYDLACRGEHVVLRFDTAELLEYEHDDPKVLSECEVVEGLEAPALRWLAEKAPQLSNTTIVIASRPRQSLQRDLKDAFEKAGKTVGLIELGALNLEETEKYFRQANDFGKEVLEDTPEMVEKVWLLSDGRPILVSLALDWLQRGMWDGEIYPIDVAKLREMHERGGTEWRQMRQRFEMALIQKIRQLSTPLDRATCYAARARKGCNAEILACIMEIPDEEAKGVVVQLLEMSFVKRPHILPRWRQEWFFLHDEMYDFVESYVWQPFWTDYAEQERIAAKIISYYSTEIQQLEQRIERQKQRVKGAIYSISGTSY